MKKAFWRLPVVALALAALLPTRHTETPSAKSPVAAFDAAPDSTANFEPHVPVLPLLGRASDSGGALRLVALAVAGEQDPEVAPEIGVALALQHPNAARAALRGLGRAPPSAL
ncbi:MAG: hypothetical protein K8T20_09545 [Planctomycetes bacterium]|nr:hypothetical protein [Planctomycetota bacterium]